MSSNRERKFVAVMFTDISGYTSIATKNEERAFELVNYKRTILFDLLKQYEGVFVKEIGDGTLSYFEDSTDAVNVAIKIIKSTYDNKLLNIRIGLHYGSVIISDKDIFGDTVNIASRVESLSSSNSILITKEIADKITLDKQYRSRELGLYAMKGVGRLIDIYNITGPKVKKAKISGKNVSGVQIHKSKKAPTIAIMPFLNKDNKKDDFYAYGISANLLNNVTSLGNIKVPNMRKVENLKGRSKYLCEKLSVQYLLNGTLWKLNDNFQISIDLYDSISKSYIWQDHWQDHWDNLSIIQSKILDGLIKTLNKSELNIYGHSQTKAEAYEYYLKGTFYYENRKTSKDIELAQGHFINAVEIDNSLLVAKNYLGVTYIQLGKIDIAYNIYQDVLKNAKNNGDIRCQAMTLSNIGEMYYRQGKYKKAMNYYNRSNKLRIKLNDIAGQASQKHNISIIQRIKGEFNLSLKSSKEVISICKKIDNNELHIKSYLNVGDLYQAKSNYKKSFNNYQKAYKMSIEYNETQLTADSLNALANAYTNLSDNQKAIKAYKKANALYKKLNNNQGIANVFNNIGLIYLHDEKFEDSKDYFNKSLKIKKKLKDKEGIANCLLNIGNLNLREKEILKAEKSFFNSLKLFKELDDVIGISFSHYSLGEAYNISEQYKESIIHFEKAKEIDKSLNDLESVEYIDKIIKNLKRKSKS